MNEEEKWLTEERYEAKLDSRDVEELLKKGVEKEEKAGRQM